MNKLSSFVITGTASGSGKTTISLGLMAAFSEMGLTVQPFKCGPDFIDPGLHKIVTGSVSRNLDIWMSGENFVQSCYRKYSSGADVAVVEGVMGMFDGGSSSSGALAGALNIPTILVLDVRSMAESAAAIVKGFETLHPEVAPVGVILNRIASPRHLELVSDAINKHCKAKILGHLPRTVEFAIPSRHLGLLTSEDSPLPKDAIELLAEKVRKHIDLPGILSLCRQDSRTPDSAVHVTEKNRCTIAVARDKAFCFYYEDNLDLFRDAGAEIVFFSPLEDSQLPEDIDAIYLGGGYPELYAQQLGNNSNMITEIRDWSENSRVIYAECGGFMYLTEGIYDMEDTFHSMVGVFPVEAKMQRKRASLGYREITTKEKSCFGVSGTVLRGHEFHYSSIDEMNPGITRVYRVNNNFTEGYQYKKTLGGYMHLHFGYSKDAVKEFINYCQE